MLDFDVIPYEDIVWGERLGAGSFGSVFKGTYLGIDIAIKEVLPSSEYDVHKYFEREWRIMRECRHPNIVLFLGLSKAPQGDGRVFIISEFVPRGNLRQFILSPNPFPWRLRLSFATDVARAVAYLHARQCIHRDLKGENLLITSNDRIKVTDFGFARITGRNEEEMKRMTYCGTDGYMSPEIINGLNFDLPTDVFSLGIIFIEIMSRRLVDSKTFIRQAPSFVPDEDEVRRRVSRGCPPALISLALDCCLEDPLFRPRMPEVLERLRIIERDVLSQLPDEGAEHVGSIKLVRNGPRAMPIFEPQPGRPDSAKVRVNAVGADADPEGDGEDDEKKMEEEALAALKALKVDGKGATEADGETWRTARWKDQGSVLSDYQDASEMRGHQRLLEEISSSMATPSTSSLLSDAGGPRVLDASAFHTATPRIDDTSSVMTIKGSSPAATDTPAAPVQDGSAIKVSNSTAAASTIQRQAGEADGGEANLMQSNREDERRAAGHEQGGAPDADEGSHNVMGTHRFTLLDKETLQLLNGKKSGFPSTFAAFLPKSKASSAKCPVCNKRLGTRPALQCDDCNVVVHVKCSHAAARNCAGENGEEAHTRKS
ncbi:hypothetical protein JCM24511_02367 [Saitozyma sp. JCM 24511]|nr:hypothetical protein JCM24511_02367 [Saitozyma sp. JCM 24511]